MEPIGLSPVLIDQVYDRLVEAIADGTLAPGQRIRQEQLADLLGVSRQPVSHALQLLKRQRLVVEHGKRFLAIAALDPARVQALYQVRAVLDALAARQAAEAVAAGTASAADRTAAEQALAAGRALRPGSPVGAYIQADVAFHAALYALSGNPALAETVAPQWPHFKRSMGAVLGEAPLQTTVWSEHEAILARVLAGDAAAAEHAAREHSLRSGVETARRLGARAPAAAE